MQAQAAPDDIVRAEYFARASFYRDMANELRVILADAPRSIKQS
jgi:hypothetical protein